MKKRSGKPIDDIFREKLQEGEKHVEYREDDWDALDKRLGRKGGVVFWIRILGGAAAVLAGLAFWLFFDRTPGEERQITQAEERQVLPDTQEKPPAGEQGPVPGRTTDTATRGTVDNAPDRRADPDTDKTEASVPAENLAEAGEQQAFPGAGIEDTGAEDAGTGAGIPARDPGLQELRTGLQGITPGQLTAGSPVSAIQPRPGRKPVPLAWSTQQTGISGEESLGSPGSGKEPLPGERFALSILAAPAFNGAGSFSNASVGGDAGLLLTARLDRKWSISTGAVYSKKTYGAGPGRYNFPYPPATPVEWIDADCRVLDIPINISYTLLEKNRNRITLGTGLSSYLMLREDYIYQYEGYGQPPDERSLNNENQHWFGVLNLQASYERQLGFLGPGLSVGLQPFLKIPVNDIGYGNVKLRSAGIAVRLNWNLPRRRP